MAFSGGIWLNSKEETKGILSAELRETIKWLLYWSLIPASLFGLLMCFIFPNPIVFLLGFASYFIQFPTSLIWLTGVVIILAYHWLRHYGTQFPKTTILRLSPKKSLILWIMVPLLAYTIPYCIIMAQALIGSTPYDPFRWDYAIFGYFIYLFIIASAVIPYDLLGLYIVMILFTVWIMGIAKLYKNYQKETKTRNSYDFIKSA